MFPEVGTSLYSGVIAGKKRRGMSGASRKQWGSCLEEGSTAKHTMTVCCPLSLLEKDSKNSLIGKNGLVGKKWLTHLVLEWISPGTCRNISEARK